MVLRGPVKHRRCHRRWQLSRQCILERARTNQSARPTRLSAASCAHGSSAASASCARRTLRATCASTSTSGRTSASGPAAAKHLCSARQQRSTTARTRARSRIYVRSRDATRPSTTYFILYRLRRSQGTAARTSTIALSRAPKKAVQRRSRRARSSMCTKRHTAPSWSKTTRGI